MSILSMTQLTGKVSNMKNQVIESTSCQYSRLDYAKDFAAAVLLMGSFFVMTWVAFALDVITTGM